MAVYFVFEGLSGSSDFCLFMIIMSPRQVGVYYINQQFEGFNPLKLGGSFNKHDPSFVVKIKLNKYT